MKIGTSFNRRFYVISCAVIAFVMLSGCPAIHRARVAQNKKLIPPGERTVTANEAGIAADSTVTLDQAIEIALSYQPSIVQAKQNLAIARAAYKNAISGFLPSTPVSAGVKRSTANAAPMKPTNKADTSYSADLGLSWVIFDFGKTPQLVKQAYKNRIAAEQSFYAASNDIKYQVTAAYLGLVNAQALLLVAEDSVRQYQAHLDQVRVLAQVGRRIVLDVTTVEVDLANAQLRLLNAQNSVQTARSTLNQTMGLAECPEYKVVEPAMNNYDPNIEKLIAVARQNNPKLKALIAKEEAASAGVNAAIGALMPWITFGAGKSWSGKDFPLIWNWYYGPSINWNPFNIYKNNAYLDQMTAELRIARADHATLEQELYSELSKAVAQLSAAQKRLTLAQLIAKQAQENLELVGEQYRVGKVSIIELTDAQVKLTSAKSEQANAVYDYQIALAQIRHIVGGELP